MDRKENVAHIYNGVLFIHNKNEIMSIAGKWIELEIIVLRKITKFRKTNITGFHTYQNSRPKNDDSMTRDCKRWTAWQGKPVGGRRGKGKGDEG
jgi:hypothetical protein